MSAAAIGIKEIRLFSDGELIANAISGREDGFEELVRRYQELARRAFEMRGHL